MSYFTLEQFKSETLSRDLARPNLFEVMITPPTSIDSNEAKLVSLLCDSASLPSQRIVTKRLNIYGETYPRPVTVQYGEIINLTFLVDSDMIIRRFFENWLDLIVNRDTNNVTYQSAAGSGTYLANSLSVFQLKKKEFDKSYQAEFEDVFPVSIQMMDLDNNQFNSVHRMNVTFEYRKWREVGPRSNTSVFRNSTLQGVEDYVNKSKNILGSNFPNLLPGIGNKLSVPNVQDVSQLVRGELNGLVRSVEGNVLGGVSADVIAETDFQTLEDTGELFELEGAGVLTGDTTGSSNQGELTSIEFIGLNDNSSENANSNSDLTDIIVLA